MPVDDIFTLLDQGKEALEARDYARARDKLMRVLDHAADPSAERAEAGRYLQHLGNDDSAQSFKLLRAIEQETDPQRRIPNLKEALDKKLVYALPLVNAPKLADLLAQATTAIDDDLLRQGEHAVESRDYSHARNLFSQLIASMPGTMAAQRADVYLKHLEPEALRQLQEIARAHDDAVQRQKLLNHALDKLGLEFALPLFNGESLADMRAKAAAEVRAAQEVQASEAKKAGDQAQANGKWSEAVDHYQHGLAFAEIGAALRKQLQQGLADCGKQQEIRDRIAAALDRAQAALDKGDYVGAQTQLEPIALIAAEDERFTQLSEQVQAGLAVIARLNQQLADAEREDNPWKAGKAYQNIADEAEAHNLSVLAQQTAEGLTAAHRRQEERAQAAQKQADKGRAAEQRSAWQEALRAYQEALRLDKKNSDALDGQMRVEQRLENIAEAERLKAQGMAARAANAWAEAERHFRNAEKHNPDDKELADLIAEAVEQARVGQTEKATLSLGLTPYKTPSEMSEKFEEVTKEKLFTETEGAKFTNDARWLFRREATFKLQKYLQPAAQMIETGDFVAALTRCKQATQEWQSYLEEEKRREEGTIPALQQRLAILDVYQDHLRAAQQIWDGLASTHAGAIAAQDASNYRKAVQAWWDILSKLEEKSAEARYILGMREGDDGEVEYAGVWQNVRQQFVASIRHLAQQWEPAWRETRWHAEDLLQRGHPADAAQHIAEVCKDLRDFEPMAQDYAAITGSPWPLEEYGAKLTGVRTQINDALAVENSLSAAAFALRCGQLDGAEGNYKKALGIAPQSQPAQVGLAAVSRLRALAEQWLQHQQNAALVEEKRALLSILHYAPEWEHANRRLPEVETALQHAAEMEGWRSQARLYQTHTNAAKAREFAQKVLVEDNKDEAMLAIVVWANQYEATVMQRAAWIADSRQALQQGDFQRAIAAADKVLASDQDPHNAEAQLLRNDAGRVQKLLEEARTWFRASPPDYDAAQDKLDQIRETTHAELQGDSAALLNEIQKAVKSNVQIQDQVAKVKRAVANEQWTEVLRLSKRYGSQFTTYADQAEKKLREAIETESEASNWIAASRYLTTLRQADLVDDDVLRWELARDRHDDLQEAERLLMEGGLEEWETQDKRLEELTQRIKDRFYVEDNPQRLPECRRQLQIRIAWEKGRQAMESPANYEIAVNYLRDALSKNPKAADRKEIQVLLDEARVNLALENVDKALDSGGEAALRTAEQALKQIKIKDERLTARLGTVMQMQTLIKDADAARDVTEAVTCLDEVLRLHANFRPAVIRRNQLIAEQRKLGQEAEAQNDLWMACRAYALLRTIAPYEENPLDELKEQLAKQIGDLSLRMNNALDNADLDATDAQALLEEIERIPADERRARATFNANLTRLRERVDRIRTIEGDYEQAKSLLADAHRVGEEEYYRVQQMMDKIRTGQAIFARRTSVRELQRALNEHRDLRKKMTEWTQTYTAALTAWQQPAAAVAADFIAPVQGFFDEGKQLLEQIINLNCDLKKHDPNNLYQLRPEFSGEAPDPLDEVHTDLLAQQINFQSIAQLLLEGIRRRDSAEQKTAQAQQKHTESTSVQEYREAQHLWEEAIENYRFAEESLQQIAQTSPLSPRARVLHQDAAQLLEKVRRSKQTIAPRPSEIMEIIAQLEELHKELKAEYEARNWETALGCCEDILEINLNDAEARSKRGELRHRREQALKERARRQRQIVGGIVAVLLVIALVVAGWYFGFGPGRAVVPTSTPLPATLPPVTAVATALPTEETAVGNTPLPEKTEAPTLAPALVIHFYDTPRICTLVQAGVMAYSEPSVESIGQALNLGVGQSIDALGETDDGEWLMLELLSGQKVWVRQNDVQCK